MDETHVINQVKEDVCYVSQDFYQDMKTAQEDPPPPRHREHTEPGIGWDVLWDVYSSSRMKGEANTVMRDYVLPDFSSIRKGFCKVRAASIQLASGR